MDPNKIQNKINKKANNGKLNDFVNSLNWLGGRLKNRIMDIRIIWLMRWLWAGKLTNLKEKLYNIIGGSAQAIIFMEKNRV